MTLHPRELSEWRQIAEWDWVHLGDGERLHAVHAITNETTVDTDWLGYGFTICGHGGTLTIPGLGSRLDAPRCQRCCVRAGIPAGAGSPKNDQRLRPVVEARLAALGQHDRD